MAKIVKVGVAAMVHDHVWGELAHWKSLPERRTGGGRRRERAAAGRRRRREYGVARVYDSWQEMVATKKTWTSCRLPRRTASGADIVDACAAKGIHVISEKPMAATLAQAERMLRASENGGDTAADQLADGLGAWPFQEWERRLLAGDIGDIFYLKYRSAHNGPKEIGCSPYFYEWLYDAEKNGAGASDGLLRLFGQHERPVPRLAPSGDGDARHVRQGLPDPRRQRHPPDEVRPRFRRR